MERLFVGILGMEVFRDSVDVFHDLDRFFEYVSINLLHDVGLQLVVIPQEVDFIGAVDVAYFDFFAGMKICFYTENRTNTNQFRL